MRIIPIMPIETMYGMVYQRAGYYIRRSPSGKIFSCKCPDRSGHIKTPAEAANQQRFAALYAGSHTPNSSSPSLVRPSLASPSAAPLLPLLARPPPPLCSSVH